MNVVHGLFYDGKSSLRRDITITRNDGDLAVLGDGIEIRVPLEQVRIDPPLGSARRMIRFPDGAAAEISDHPFLDELQRHQGRGYFFRVLNRWERSLQLAGLALILLLLVGFAFIRYCIPALATKAAFALPAATEEAIGLETLQMLDRVLLKPTQLSEQRRRELLKIFSSVKARFPEGGRWQLVFRSGETVGANALALPSGSIVITDRLVTLAASDQEIAAVLAHEIGHLQGRHALRQLMQNSASALIVATVTGDITSLSATLPTLLIDSKYSRDFEMEADDAAVDYLRSERIPVRVYADILTRLGDEHRERVKQKPSHLGEILADHPLIEERVKRVMSGKK